MGAGRRKKRATDVMALALIADPMDTGRRRRVDDRQLQPGARFDVLTGG
jgi:hypothetical protein